ncbi:flagellar basal-body rod protein FlgF [Hirschia baltica]|uniref:Flagellar basal-body rod protein FlgF n=1 Tax=Hirschia baltica (strain ATCC 49814 / DSM 5838 / IFAM 1418) TaxID=582402 RepID=C6XN62_HIRBI|nr:flagellar basal-body rod protein FlgF [Hirschia baltica]ACT58232.1 flagellar basal-body rod protein FlgF [Hirschia baltica ATCC 49814]
MDNSLAIGLSTQQLLRKKMDVTANNLANMNTTGFKVEHLVNHEISDRPARATDKPHDITFTQGWQLQRDMNNGSIAQTGNPLDVAIDGNGFFEVEAENGDIFYTRDGEFSMNPDGMLVTRNGYLLRGEGEVLDGEKLLANGVPIALNPEGGEIVINKDGSIMQDGAQLGQLKLKTFELPEALEKVGNNLYISGEQEPIDANATLAQGFVESSNVSAIVEMTQMIEISRAYQSVAKLISNSNDMREKAINKLAQVR